jgi:malate dehydrogenase (oxaloacetate-decarboxylating)(NADP+)
MPPSSRPLPAGADLLHDPRLNKGTAFTEAERDQLGLRGLLPPRVISQAEQEVRVLASLRAKPTALEQYIYLTALQDRNERLFYRVVMNHLEEVLPIIYTPTVGEACRQFGQIFRRPRGLYLTAADRGRFRRLLGNWPEPEVEIIVVTDGGRVLGLGDLGANGMGIPIGKLALYTACAGVDPARCMPVTLDVGTEQAELLADPLYLGLTQRRLRGADYDALVDEFVSAVQEVFSTAVVQFEDFASSNALRLLARYRDRACVFNDDIQGTGAVALAGLLAAARIAGRRLTDEIVLFLGAGSAALGIAEQLVGALHESGMSLAEARHRLWFVDAGGLLASERTDLSDYQRVYARPEPAATDLLTVMERARPTALIGVSGQRGAFTEPVVRAMARLNPRPVIFPLSNPTSCAECTADEAHRWSEGRAIFASGSPSLPVQRAGRPFRPSQANNAYIFPGVGFGVIAARAERVTDPMFRLAATTLAGLVDPGSLEQGLLFPPLTQIREVSHAIARAVATFAWDTGLARAPRPADIGHHLRVLRYDPEYPRYV